MTITTREVPYKPYPPLKIICDTKEQQPFTFEPYSDVIVYRDKLDAGDYTIVGQDMPGDDHSVIIERKKSCSELLTNLGSKWEQFKAEAEKLQKYSFKQIVVHEPSNFEHLYDMELTRLSPGFVYKQLSILATDYGVHTIFLSSKQAAENYVYRLFYRLRNKIIHER